MKDCQSHYLWIDSTTLPVCKNQRIQRHKSLAVIATRGKSSMGWFFGCKLHLIMNQSGEIVSTALSNGHTADIKMVERLVEGLKAKIYADRGYISQELKSRLKSQGNDLITYHRKNMKSVQLATSDEYQLKQHNKIETLFSLLKGKYHLVTSKERSLEGYLAGIYAVYPNGLLPLKAKRRCKFDSELKIYNQAINKRRIGIEHIFGRLKTFKILAERYRNRGKRLGLRFNLIVGIYNLELSKK